MIIMNMSAQDDLKNISTKLDTIANDHKETATKVSEIRGRLFDPDDGLYSRVKGLQGWAEHHEEECQEQNKRYQELHKDLKKTLESIDPLTDDYKIRMSRKKWIDKVVYVVLAAVIGITVKNVSSIDNIHVAAAKEKQKSHGSHSVVITKSQE